MGTSYLFYNRLCVTKCQKMQFASCLLYIDTNMAHPLCQVPFYALMIHRLVLSGSKTNKQNIYWKRSGTRTGMKMSPKKNV